MYYAANQSKDILFANVTTFTRAFLKEWDWMLEFHEAHVKGSLLNDVLPMIGFYSKDRFQALMSSEDIDDATFERYSRWMMHHRESIATYDAKENIAIFNVDQKVLDEIVMPGRGFIVASMEESSHAVLNNLDAPSEFMSRNITDSIRSLPGTFGELYRFFTQYGIYDSKTDSFDEDERPDRFRASEARIMPSMIARHPRLMYQYLLDPEIILDYGNFLAKKGKTHDLAEFEGTLKTHLGQFALMEHYRVTKNIPFQLINASGLEIAEFCFNVKLSGKLSKAFDYLKRSMEKYIEG